VSSHVGTDKLTSAIEYVDYGWALLPIGPDKRPHWNLLPIDRNGKVTWKPLACDPVNKKEIEHWFKSDPDCNIGIITGQPSGGIVVADFDRKPPKKLYMPPTPRVVTSRMFHLYFKSSTIIKSRSFPWGELKGDVGYCVLPPSNHPTGCIYKWEELLSPNDVDFADPPSWIYDRTTSQKVFRKTSEASREYSLLASQPKETGFSGYKLGAWDSNECFVIAACDVLGIPITAVEDIGKSFCCILPGHKDKRPSASLFKRSDGLIVYRDWHVASGQEWYYLADVRAAQCYGMAVNLNPPERAVWHLRLLIETGFAAPVVVDAIPLPEDVDWWVKRTYEGFLLLLGCKWLHSPGAPTSFSWRFASTWCGVSERYAGKAINELLHLGLIQIVGKEHGLTVFLPGT
jgi:hypothetical protein